MWGVINFGKQLAAGDGVGWLGAGSRGRPPGELSNWERARAGGVKAASGTVDFLPHHQQRGS